MKFWLLKVVALSMLMTGLSYAQTLTLSEAMQSTLKNNDELLSKTAKYNADKEQLNQAWSRVKPNISASLMRGRSDYSTTAENNQFSPTKRYSLNIVQPVFSKKLFEGIERTESAVEAQKLTLNLERKTKLVEVSQSFIETLKFQEAVRISARELEDHHKRVKQIKAMLERGLSNKVDLLEAESRLDILRSNLVKDQSDYNVAKNSLERLVGFKIDNLEKLEHALWQRSNEILKHSDWYEVAYKNSYSIEVAEQRLLLAEKDVSLNKADYWPELNLRFSMNSSETYETSIESDKKIQLELNVPIYEGGLTDSKVAAARYTAQSEKHFVKDQERFIAFKLGELLSTLEGSVASIKALQQSKLSNKAYLDSAQKGLAFGLRGVFDVLEAKSRLYDVERRLLFEIHDNVMTQVEFLYLLGMFSPEQVHDYFQNDFSVSTLKN